MRLRLVLAAVIVTSVIVVGCGGSPSQPSDPGSVVTVVTSSPMKFINGRTGQVVNLSGVTVVTSRGTSTVASNATVEMRSDDLSMSISAPGYRSPYKTVYQSGRTDYVLSPEVDTTSGLDETYSKQMIFGDSSAYDNPGMQSSRILKSAVTFYFESGATDAMKAELVIRVAQFQIATGVSAQVGDGSALPGTMGCPVSFDSTLPVQARTILGVTKGLITSCKIVFHGIENFYARNILHELLHTFGLLHWMGEGMLGKTWKDSNLVYATPELEAIRLLKSMMPGASYVYDDSLVYPSLFSTFAISAPSGVERQIVVNCNDLK